jgi:hypothetical protein
MRMMMPMSRDLDHSIIRSKTQGATGRIAGPPQAMTVDMKAMKSSLKREEMGGLVIGSL